MKLDFDLSHFIDEFYDRVQDLPFENSDFQNLCFVVANQGTPERAQRAIALQLQSRLQALREAYYRLQREEVEIEKLQEQIADEKTNRWDRRLAEIDLEEKHVIRKETAKLVADALHTTNFLKELLDEFPLLTRTEFETGEQEHFRQRLQRQLDGVVGAQEALTNMSRDVLSLAQAVPGLLAAAGTLLPHTLLEAKKEQP